jgi:hypothetical protein
MRTDSDNIWWNSLKHGGMLIAPSRLDEYFPGSPQPLGSWIADNLRRDITNLKRGKTETETALINTVLKRVCELDDINLGIWSSGSEVPSKYSHRLITGEDFRPRRVWESKNGDVFPVFVDKESRIGVGRGRRSTAKVIEWLRKSGLTLALLTNAQQFRLIYAGSDHDAWVEWDTELWFEEGKPSAQVDALRMLLSPRALLSVDGKPSPLIDAILESRKGEAELSQELGENVRRAVEILIKSHTPALRDIVDNSTDRDINKHIYLAATRIIMRMVVILFAEARDLLPRDNQVYNSSYSLQGLREQLDRVASGISASGRLKNREFAWPRILALFNIVYHGSHAAKLPITKYGGGLFKPGDRESSDPVSKVLQIFESACFNPETNIMDDFTVHQLLVLLTQTNVKLRQGRSFTTAKVPVDFSNISSEYIGIIYEGLLDYELRRANVDDPIVFLNLGDQPALPLKRLEQMDDKQLSNLVEKIKAKPSKNPGGEEESESEDEEPDEDIESDDDESTEDDLIAFDELSEDDSLGSRTASPLESEGENVEDDIRMTEFNRAVEWARRASKAGGLVAKPRSKKQSEIDKFENEISIFANKLVNPDKIILPGEWYLVRWGGTRKGSGTFYTRPQLAYPTVVRTIRPLAYDLGSRTASPQSSEDTSVTGNATVPVAMEYTPKTPEEILALKICDPAMGSGSFLVGATRFLTDALFDSLHYHGRIQAYQDGTLICLAEGKPAEGDIAKQLLPCKPDDADFDEKLKAQLKRHIVEKCIYGVDINPLAVELARLSLWVETMDRNLPFEFIDHKLKVGNALIGCWFDRWRHYPALAWVREGGDKSHNNGVLYKADEWTKRIKKILKDKIKPLIEQFVFMTRAQYALPFYDEYFLPREFHKKISELMSVLHALALDYEGNKCREENYFRIIKSEGFRHLKELMDYWCSIWFWPLEELGNDDNFNPVSFPSAGKDALEIAERVASKLKFFHWEIEFPEVFNQSYSGFDAVIGNPPWNIMKPNSKEFFSNYDPLYRTYGKQEAIAVQKRLFEINPDIEKDWLDYNAQIKAMSNWVKYSADPFNIGAGRDKALENSLVEWSEERRSEPFFADPKHPYIHQGSADINSYKLFLELAHTLLKEGGQLGLIVPSGVYTDKGTTDIRKLFINQCSWEWLFGFINRGDIFSPECKIYKFAIVEVRKSNKTESIRTSFMIKSLSEWENVENNIFIQKSNQITKFSPKSGSLLEINSERDLEILNKIYSNSVLLGDDSPDGWGIKYATEFHMTNDSHLFPPRPKWEAKGYKPDQYGRWIGPDGDIALPLYQGLMIWHFDFSVSAYVSGTGMSAKWIPQDWENKQIIPQYLMSIENYEENGKRFGDKLVFRDISKATNQRTMVSTIIPNMPCGNKVPILLNNQLKSLCILPVLNSFAFDWAARQRTSGNTMNYYIVEEFPLLLSKTITCNKRFVNACISLTFPAICYARYWLEYKNLLRERINWKQLWAITPHERLRIRSMLDAIVAELYGLDYDDFAYILKDCDHPTEQSTSKSFTRALDPKGFWRVDKQKDPELRHTVLSLVAFKDLKGMIESCDGDRDKGIEKFCTQNDSDGWMLPETLTLADYGLGHDDRAKHPQPVASVLGERFLPWQLEQSVEDSWKECEMHARNILGPDGFTDLMAEIRGEKKKEPKPEASGVKKSKKTDSFGLFD